MGTSDPDFFLLWLSLVLNQHAFGAMPTFTNDTSFGFVNIQQADVLPKYWFWFWS
jgi:hypothetical protein